MIQLRESDSSALNAETTPPQDEFIDLRCIWAVEFYTPAHLDRLLEGIRKLGWYQKKALFRPEEDPVAWICRSRQSSSGRDYLDIDPVYPCGTVPSPSAQTAQLPLGVQYAIPRIYSLTSSLTCVVMGFVFEEDFSAKFDMALRTNRKIYAETSLKNEIQISDPEKQKTDHIIQIRNDMTKLSIKWFRENLPGVFSSNAGGEILPTCEFVTLRLSEPYLKRGTSTPKYMSVLDMVDSGVLDFWRGRKAWQSKNISGLKLGVPQKANHSLRHHLILAIKESDFKRAATEATGLPDRQYHIHYINHGISDLLSKWAIISLLESYDKNISAIRDSAVFRPESHQSPVEVLKTLGHHASDSVDITAVTTELIPSTQQNLSFAGMNFEPCDKQYHTGQLEFS